MCELVYFLRTTFEFFPSIPVLSLNDMSQSYCKSIKSGLWNKKSKHIKHAPPLKWVTEDAKQINLKKKTYPFPCPTPSFVWAPVGFHRIQAVDMILHFLIELKHNIRILLKMLTDKEWRMGLSTLNQKLMLFQSLFKYCIRFYKVLRLGL